MIGPIEAWDVARGLSTVRVQPARTQIRITAARHFVTAVSLGVVPTLGRQRIFAVHVGACVGDGFIETVHQVGLVP